MEEEYIDIHNMRGRYERVRARLLADPRINELNKALIERFLREAALGKTIVGRARTRIGPSRLANYAKHFISMADFLPPDLENATSEQIERLVLAIENNEVRSRLLKKVNGCLQPSQDVLSPQYKADLKGTIKKFYKWLQGNNRVYPELVAWIDTFVQHKEIPALTEQEIATLLEQAESTLDRALLQVLFDGGFRIAELLNVRLRHVSFVSLDNRLRRRGVPDGR